MIAGDLFEEQLEVAGQFPVPRPFQDAAHHALRAGVISGHKSQLLCAPTGAGKTVIGLRVAKEAMDRNRRAIFLCDRITLIEQTSARADSYGLNQHGIVQATHWRRDNSQPLQIASIQTITRRGFWPETDVLIVDEAHTRYPAVSEFIHAHPKVAVVGLTATPCSKGLGLDYTNLINAATMHDLTQQGVLVPLRWFPCVTPDMTGALTSGGEWTARAAAERELTIVGDVVGEWQKNGEGRKTIAFGADIAYCTELAARFNAAGVNAATCTSETPAGEVEELLKEFAKPDSVIRVLVSVEKLAKGFDVQDVGCIIDARPLRKSLSTAIQMWGRGLRSTPDGEKKDCILLDHSGNFMRFYADFEDIYHNGFRALSSAEKLDSHARKDDAEDFEPRGCPQCGKKPFRKHCLSCGFERVTTASVDEAGGVVIGEIKFGKKVAAQSKADLWAQLCTYAKHNIRGKQSGWAWYKYQEIVGCRPPNGWKFESAPIVAPSAALVGKLKSMQIAYRSRTRAAA